MRQLLGGVRRQRWVGALGGVIGAVVGWIVSNGSEATAGSTIVAVAVGLVAGVLAVLVLSMVWQAITRRLKDRPSVESAFALPVLAELPDLEDEFGPPRSLLGGLAAADQQLVEPFELVRLSLVDALHPFNPETGVDVRRGLVVLVSPSSSEVSVGEAAENLGATLAENGHRVLLIDGNLTTPSLSSELALDGRGRGLLDASASGPLLASGSFDLDHIVEATEHELVSVVGFGAGPGVDQPGRVMSRVGPFFDAARARYAVIVVAGPVPTVTGGGIELAALADRHVLVAKSGVTTSGDAKQVTALLEQLQLSVDGVVLSGRSPNALRLRRKRRRLERRASAPVAPIGEAVTAEAPTTEHEAVTPDDQPVAEGATEGDEAPEVVASPPEVLFAEAETDSAGVIPDDVTGGTLNVRNWFDPIHSDTPPPEGLFTTGDLAEMAPLANGDDPGGEVGDEGDDVDFGRGPLDDQLELLDESVLEELGDLEPADLAELDGQDAEHVELPANGDFVEGSFQAPGFDAGTGDTTDGRNGMANEAGGLEDLSPGAESLAGDDPAGDSPVEHGRVDHEEDDAEPIHGEGAQPAVTDEVVITGLPPLPDDAALEPEPDDEPPRSRDLAGLNLDLLDGLEDEDELNTTRP